MYTSVIFCFFGYIRPVEIFYHPPLSTFQEETVLLKNGFYVNKKLFLDVMQCLGFYVYTRANVEILI